MSSEYTFPEDAIHWAIEDNQLLIVTEDTDDVDEELESIGEDVTEGLLIKYYGNPVLLDPEQPDIADEELPVSGRVHSAILEYVLAKLYDRKQDPSGVDVQRANHHFSLFEEKVYRLKGGKPKPKGMRRVIPQAPFAIK